MNAKLSSYNKKQLKFCLLSYKSGAITHTTSVSESCLSLEAMNSSVCIHMAKIIEVERLEYAIFSALTKKKRALVTNFYTIFVLKPVFYSV